MIEIEKPRIETLDLLPDGTYGKFIVEPLERGYGITLGNSLRRVLLSSLPGVAVNSVKIDGILHEFDTIPGVKEDVAEIILNIKGLIASIHGDGPKVVYIEANGPCEVDVYKRQVPAIQGLRRVSKPGLRIYTNVEDMPKVLRGLGVAIISTSKGVMTDRQARKEKVGGEVLAFIW